MRPVVTWLLAMLLSLVCVAAVRAQEEDPSTAARDAEGRGLFEAGRAAFADGRYDDALDYFDRAYVLTHRAELLYNIGTANDRLRRDATALAAFEEYIRELPDAANVREVEARMRVLREALAEEAAGDTAATDASSADADASATSTETSAPTQTAAPAEPASSDSGPGVVGEWWFWTILGAVVVGGVVVGVVLGTQSGGTTYPPYLQGTEGTTMTLTVAL